MGWTERIPPYSHCPRLRPVACGRTAAGGRTCIFAVRAETLHRSKVTMRTRARMIHQYVRETFPDRDVSVPSYQTLWVVWREWFGPGGARQRYARSAELPAKNGHVLVHRPGQVIALDTTVLPVMVREGVFGDPVTCHLTLAMDVHAHSLCAFRLTLVSDQSVDVAMLLRDVMLPLPMRSDWGEELEWPYPGLPAAVVAEFAGHKVAGLPFFAPETVTTDHGSVYRNHHLVDVQRVLGCNVLPSRVLRPTDKSACERAFGAVRSLLFEQLPGLSRRRREPDPAATRRRLETPLAPPHRLCLPPPPHSAAQQLPQVRESGSHGPHELPAPSGDRAPPPHPLPSTDRHPLRPDPAIPVLLGRLRNRGQPSSRRCHPEHSARAPGPAPGPPRPPRSDSHQQRRLTAERPSVLPGPSSADLAHHPVLARGREIRAHPCPRRRDHPHCEELPNRRAGPKRQTRQAAPLRRLHRSADRPPGRRSGLRDRRTNPHH